MTKIIAIPSNIEEIDRLTDIVDGFIIGISDMCVNVNLTISDLSILKSIKNKDIFVALNKNMHNSDLNRIKNILQELNNYSIKGVLYCDVAVLSLYNSLNLNYDLVWSAEHATTNYSTINYWNKFNVNYVYLSSDITEEEVNEISKNVNVKTLVNMFGYLPMFVSKRHIVKNYLEYFNLSDSSSINYIEKEGNFYPIIDNNIGTSCYYCNILNGIKSYINMDVDYIVLNSFLIETSKFIEVVKLFKTVNKDNVLEYYKKINNMFKNVDTGFLNKKTIYRVKKDEKKM